MPASERVVNFGAGPACLPTVVLERAQKDLMNYKGTGVSVMEMSHRSAAYTEIHGHAIATLKELLSIPDNYSVLFCQGGASLQFSAVPMNLLPRSPASKAAYLITGQWSKKAQAEAARYGTVQTICDGSAAGYCGIPASDTWETVDKDAAYVLYCANETVHGIEFPAEVPEALKESNTGVPVVADMSSNFLSRPINVADYGLIFAGAQKNSGIAGVTVIIIRDDLLATAPLPSTPTMMQYAVQKKGNSLVNTPPTWSIYMASLVFDWVKEQGGVEAMAVTSAAKAKALYTILDAEDAFEPTVTDKASRSHMNVTFRLKGGEGDAVKALVAAAGKEEDGRRAMIGLAGHRSVGGLRASLYNAISVQETEALASFLLSYAQ